MINDFIVKCGKKNTNVLEISHVWSTERITLYRDQSKSISILKYNSWHGNVFKKSNANYTLTESKTDLQKRIHPIYVEHR